MELGTSLVLAGDYTLADFQTDRAALLALMDEVSTKAAASRTAQETRDALRANLLMRHRQFRGTLQGLITTTGNENGGKAMKIVRPTA